MPADGCWSRRDRGSGRCRRDGRAGGRGAATDRPRVTLHAARCVRGWACRAGRPSPTAASDVARRRKRRLATCDAHPRWRRIGCNPSLLGLGHPPMDRRRLSPKRSQGTTGGSAPPRHVALPLVRVDQGPASPPLRGGGDLRVRLHRHGRAGTRNASADGGGVRRAEGSGRCEDGRGLIRPSGPPSGPPAGLPSRPTSTRVRSTCAAGSWPGPNSTRVVPGGLPRSVADHGSSTFPMILIWPPAPTGSAMRLWPERRPTRITVWSRNPGADAASQSFLVSEKQLS
jgi:hypothetical protein